MRLARCGHRRGPLGLLRLLKWRRAGDANLWDTTTGDFFNQPALLSARSLFRFSLAGLAGQNVQGALLTVTLVQTRKDRYPVPGIVSHTPPFVNPGLGDLSVIHVPDYVAPGGAAFSTASLGSDPGVLVPSGVNPNAALLSIDVTAAMQQAIDANLAFVTFRLQTATGNDNDNLNDTWNFYSADNPVAGTNPNISFSLASPVGADVPEPSSFALSLTAAAVAFAARRWRDRTQTQSPALQQ